MKFIIPAILLFLFFGCKEAPNSSIQESSDLSAISSKDFREFKVLDSKYIDPDEVWQPFENVLKDFTQDYHDKLKSMILEQDIPTIQTHINSGSLSYLDLTRFYLFR
ncbi:MAG: amidase, partial [Flavobacteriaceae bacterium]|nr:amidase [Bacteroidia bacterium]NNL61383.1 amidase [Flavobacteriaceae bacterium]